MSHMYSRTTALWEEAGRRAVCKGIWDRDCLVPDIPGLSALSQKTKQSKQMGKTNIFPLLLIKVAKFKSQIHLLFALLSFLPMGLRDWTQVVYWNRVFCSQDWPWTWCTVKNDLELSWSSCLRLPNTEIIGVCHDAWVYLVLGIKLKAWFILGKHSTKWAMFPAL